MTKPTTGALTSAALLVIGAAGGSFFLSASFSRAAPPRAEQIGLTLPPPEGFASLKDVRFDESMGGNLGGRRPTPTIPKTWKFIGVSNGEKMNSNNLWFQDPVSGNVYLIQGFATSGQFVMDDRVQLLHAK